MTSFIKYLKASFNARLFLASITLIVGTAMSLNYYFFIHQQDELLTSLANRGISLARILAHDSRLGVFTGDSRGLMTPAKMILAEQDCLKVIIFDKDGNTLLQVRADKDPVQTGSVLNPKYIFNQIPSHPESWPVSFSSDDTTILIERIFAAQPFSRDDLFLDDFFTPHREDTVNRPTSAPIGYAAAIMTNAAIKRKTVTFLEHSVVVTFAITMVSCLLVFLALKLLTRPLASLTSEIEHHHQAARSETGSQAAPEDFRKMITFIRESFLTINELKDNLETQVESRTVELKISNDELAQQKHSLEQSNLKLENTLEQLQVTQKQLVHSEKMAALGQMISGLSHEINNSVNFITGSLPLLEKNMAIVKRTSSPTDEREAGALQKAAVSTDTLMSNIKEGVNRITGIISELSTFAHSHGDMILTDIQEGLSASIAILSHEYKDRITLTEELAPNLPQVMSHRGQLNQVFLNILINSAHAIEGHGTIKIKTWSTDNHVHVSISDNGCGIKPNELTHIFDPFFTTKEVGKGTGLGLSVSYSIIKNHGGEITVDSTTGEGSVFEVILPH